MKTFGKVILWIVVALVILAAFMSDSREFQWGVGGAFFAYWVVKLLQEREDARNRAEARMLGQIDRLRGLAEANHNMLRQIIDRIDQ